LAGGVSGRATTVRGVSNRFADWIEAYETAWRTEGTAPLAQLFSEDATYQAAPFDEPLAGVEAIARFWEDEREGPGEAFTLISEIVAAQGDTAVARLEIVYGDPPQRTCRDL
jgi:SnoaL-like domain